MARFVSNWPAVELCSLKALYVRNARSSRAADFKALLSTNVAQLSSTKPDGERLVLVHEMGWAVVPIPGPDSPSISLLPWARVEGILRHGDGVGAGQTVGIESGNQGPPGASAITLFFSTRTDEAGRFHFEKVPAGRVRLYRYFEENPGGAGRTVLPHPSAKAAPMTIRLQAGLPDPCGINGTFELCVRFWHPAGAVD